MGVITGSSENFFISADFVYSKIKRQFASFAAVNLLDDMDFPAYTMDVLRELGIGAMKESEAVSIIQNGQAKLPKDFYKYYAAYRCSNFGMTRTPNKLLQNKMVFENDSTCEILQRSRDCEIDCCTDKLISRITVRQFVNEDLITYNYGNLGLLNLTPNVRQRSEHNSRSISIQSNNDITINDGYVFTNFMDDAIFLQYYAYPFDENGLPMIIDSNPYVEKAVEWYIKWQILQNFWLVDEVSNALNKWQEAENMYTKNLAEARHHNKIPAFSTLINYMLNKRGVNAVTFFSQIDRYR